MMKTCGDRVDRYGKRFQCVSCGGTKCLAHYEDGDYCFRCNTLNKIDDFIYKYIPEPTHSANVNFTVVPLSAEQVRFLKDKFSYSDEVINYYQICYTNDYGGRYVIMAKWGDGNTFYQLRTFNPNITPKSLSFGSKPFYIFEPKCRLKDDILFIVEDPFSAIKVSSAGFRTFCLFGTCLKQDYVLQLAKKMISENYKKLYIWLDGDIPGQTAAKKIKESMKFYIECKNIITKDDPKYYTTGQIRELV